MSDNFLLHVNHVSVGFRSDKVMQTVVEDLSFKVHENEVLAIVGESGSGKSVSSMSLLGLNKFSGGAVTAGNLYYRTRDNTVIDLATISEKRMREIRGNEISIIFQEPMTSLNPGMTVGKQVREALIVNSHNQRNAKSIDQQASELLQLTGLSDVEWLKRQYPPQLSGGMLQRVMIAGALAGQPRLLIADEPTTALDVTTQKKVIRIIRDLQARFGMAVIFITHDIAVVAEIADRILVMHNGRFVESGPTRQIIEHPQQNYTKALLSAVPYVGAMKDADGPTFFQHSVLKDDCLVDGWTKTMDLVPPRYDEPPILSVKNLAKVFPVRKDIIGRPRYQLHAVDNISFDVFKGEVLGIVGESGSGKTTTGRLLSLLKRPTSGRVWYESVELSQMKPQALRRVRRHIQYVFQDPFSTLDPRRSVGYTIMEPILVHKTMSKAAAKARALELLELCGLDRSMASRYPHEFSGGQRQRICVARALSLSPKIIIADEAVSALDVTVQAEVINLLLSLQAQFGISVVFISHDMAVIEKVSHRVLVMLQGRIVEYGRRRDIFENPQHDYTRSLLSAVPSLTGNALQHFDDQGESVLESRLSPVGHPLSQVEYETISPWHFVEKQPEPTAHA